MNMIATDRNTLSFVSNHAKAVGQCEDRLDAVCELIEEEIRHGNIGDDELANYARRITSEVDQALTDETRWYSPSDFI